MCACPKGVRSAGFELQIAKNAEDLVDLAQWAHDESLCCPFLTFQLQVEPGGKCISTRVTEPEGAHGFLRTELKALKVL